MKNFARIIAPVALFALASLAAVACSDPEIEHYTNPDSDVYLDRLLGIEGAAEPEALGRGADRGDLALAQFLQCPDSGGIGLDCLFHLSVLR